MLSEIDGPVESALLKEMSRKMMEDIDKDTNFNQLIHTANMMFPYLLRE